MNQKKITILGAGSWGLTLAWLLESTNSTDEQSSRVVRDVWLWDRKPEKIAAIAANRQVQFPVEVTVPDGVTLSDNLTDTVRDADVVLLVVTTKGTRGTLEKIRDTGVLSPEAYIVNASKGIEFPTLKPLSQVMAEVLPDHTHAVLSGPTLAKEILAGLPTASAVACEDHDAAERLQQWLTCAHQLRLYSNHDVVGVELGGALKNVFAIVSGYMQAKKLGDNARAALITRGLAEMTRFIVTRGGDPQTLYGLSGLGDLLATCNSPLSRNFQVGYRMAQGKALPEILDELKVVAEGVVTAQAVAQLSDAMGIDMPIVKLVVHALQGEMSDDEIIRNLMSRKLKREIKTGAEA